MLKKFIEKMVHEYLDIIEEMDLSLEEIEIITTDFFLDKMAEADDVFEQLILYHVFKEHDLLDFIPVHEFPRKLKPIISKLDELSEGINWLHNKQIELIEEKESESEEDFANSSQIETEPIEECEDELIRGKVMEAFFDALSILYGDEFNNDMELMANHLVDIKLNQEEEYLEAVKFINGFLEKNVPEVKGGVKFDLIAKPNNNVIETLTKGAECLNRVELEEIDALSCDEIEILKGIIQSTKYACSKFELKLDELHTDVIQ